MGLIVLAARNREGVTRVSNEKTEGIAFMPKRAKSGIAIMQNEQAISM